MRRVILARNAPSIGPGGRRAGVDAITPCAPQRNGGSPFVLPEQRTDVAKLAKRLGPADAFGPEITLSQLKSAQRLTVDANREAVRKCQAGACSRLRREAID